MKNQKNKLAGKRIAILAADGFEYIELAAPLSALRAAGAEVDVVSLHAGRIRGMNLTEPGRTVRVDKPVEEAEAADYDGLFVPGGFIGPDFLRQSEMGRAFVRAFDEVEKPIVTLCHGPWVLISAERVGNRVLASWPGIRDDIVHAGGVWRDEAVVRDRNWLTSRSPQDLPLLMPAMIDLFASGETDMTVKWGKAMGSSPKVRDPIRSTLMAARLLPSPGFTFLAASALTAIGAYAMRR